MRMTLWPSSSVALKFEMYPSSFRIRAISTFRREAGTSTFWCRACSALRTLVSISATGSVNLIVCFSSRRPFAPSYGEPAAASYCYFLQVISNETILVTRERALPGRLRHSRDLAAQCQSAETQAADTKLAQIGSRPPADLAAVVPAAGKLGRRRLTVARRFKLFFDLCVLDSFGCCHEILLLFRTSKKKSNLLPERHAQMLQQRARLTVIRSRGHNGDVHALHLVDLLVRNFREDQLIVQAEGVVAPSIKRLGRYAAKITHPWQNNIYEPVEKFIHTVSAQGDHGPDRLPLAHFERRNRLLRFGNDGLLAGDLPQFIHRGVENLRILRRLAHAHVDHNLVQAGNRHGILEFKLFQQRRCHFLFKAGPQPRPLLGAMPCLLRSLLLLR